MESPGLFDYPQGSLGMLSFPSFTGTWIQLVVCAMACQRVALASVRKNAAFSFPCLVDLISPRGYIRLYRLTALAWV